MATGKRILLFPIPLQGHLNPMLQLASILQNKGFSISIIHTQFNAPTPAHHPSFVFHFIPDGLTETQTRDPINLFAILNGNCQVPLRDCLSKIMGQEEEEEPVACLITDIFWYSSQSIADGLKLPRLVLRTANVSSFVPLVALPLLKEKGYFPVKDTQLEESVPEIPPLKIKDIPRLGNPETFFEFVYKICEGTRLSQGLIFNSFEELEGPALARLRQEFDIPLYTVGPFHKLVPSSSSSFLTPDKSCISWLDTQAPASVLYVSFGSLAAISESQFLEVAWGLVNSKQPFLWVIRPGLVRGSEGPHPLPDALVETVRDRRSYIVDWAPQEEVLAHPAVGGFWTHSGWNSTLESICEGVPMICYPSFADQMVNARHVSDVWRVGINLENVLERGEVEKTVRKLMHEKDGEEMRERAAELKERALQCLKEGGSSYRSMEYLVRYISSS